MFAQETTVPGIPGLAPWMQFVLAVLASLTVLVPLIGGLLQKLMEARRAVRAITEGVQEFKEKAKLTEAEVEQLHGAIQDETKAAGVESFVHAQVEKMKTRRLERDQVDVGGSPPAALGLLFFALVLSSGCVGSMSDAYVAADRKTFVAIAPELRAYYASDPKLDADQKASREDTLASWEARIKRAEAAKKATADASTPRADPAAPKCPSETVWAHPTGVSPIEWRREVNRGR